MKLRWVYLIPSILLLVFSVRLHAELITFGVTDDEPPLSSIYDEKAYGLIPDMIRLVFDYLPGYRVKAEAYPWPRAQYLVEHGQLDALLTYPSEKRQKYATFSSFPVYRIDFGYLIFRKDHPKRALMESAEEFSDLVSLTVVTQVGAEWEADNIPKALPHKEVKDLESMIHLVLGREEGDYFIMPPEQAVYLAKKFGYQHRVSYAPVRFIPDSLIPFHIGIRKDHPHARLLVKEINKLANNTEFIKKKQALIDRYRE
ncbi:substrate-binding periplasmic protein [Litoribrevibacter euphylliae]|uniref:Substrate-binding periplasmic protein n=1 Tax=Litoribrevibacter euphylliae TaxID=1834034 RepID=A0ABV7HH40_9GAMM